MTQEVQGIEPTIPPLRVLICGFPASGKTTSLMYIKEPKSVYYLGCEFGKHLPFPNPGFTVRALDDPDKLLPGFQVISKKPEIKTIVIDSLTYWLEQVECKYVMAKDAPSRGYDKWTDYKRCYFDLITKGFMINEHQDLIVMAHNIREEVNGVVTTRVAVRGELKRLEVESLWDYVIYCERKPVEELEEFHNKYLKITPREKRLGYKFVFKVLPYGKDQERIRSPHLMWDIYEDKETGEYVDETYIDANINYIKERWVDYYSGKLNLTKEQQENETTEE